MTKGLKKKTIITALLANTSHKSPFIATYFRVGNRAITLEGNEILTMPVVKKITFARHAWGQGAAVDMPCYCISFMDSDELIIIPETKIEQITLTSDYDDNKSEEFPELPE